MFHAVMNILAQAPCQHCRLEEQFLSSFMFLLFYCCFMLSWISICVINIANSEMIRRMTKFARESTNIRLRSKWVK